MRLIMWLASCLALAVTLLTLPAQAQTCNFAAMQSRFESLLQAEGLAGGALLLGDRQGLLHEQYLGSYTSGTVVAIASASKLLSAARILQLIGDGSLDGDAPVSSYLPQFSGEKGGMTVLQMFSHTAGFGDDSGDPLVFDRTTTLAEAVDEIACCRELTPGYSVGAQFGYGGVSMHVAGRVAEIVSAEDWQAGWLASIGAPLGVTTIDWQGFGATSNYGIAGSARSNLRDYGKVLHMLLNHGRGNGQGVIGGDALAPLRIDRVGSLPVAYAPPGVTAPVGYSVGAWLDGLNTTPQPGLIHSLGAFGFLPWIDFERGIFGVFMIRGLGGINGAAIPAYRDMLQAISAELDANDCDWIETFEEVLVDGFE